MDRKENCNIKKSNEFISFEEYNTNLLYEDYWNLFNEKVHRSPEKISARVISHWEQEGLFNIQRETKEDWRRYSLMDLLWIKIINELRTFNIGLENIKHIKQSLIGTQNKFEYGILEHYAALIHLQRVPVSLIIFADFRTEIATVSEFVDLTRGNEKLNYISIGLNGLMNDLFPDIDLLPVQRNLIEVTEIEQEILKTIGLKEVEEIKLLIENGIPIKMDFIINEIPASNIGQLKIKDPFQEINVKQHRGKTISVKRTLSKKLK
jgi:DNA-binding transcriptional MerR regulator